MHVQIDNYIVPVGDYKMVLADEQVGGNEIAAAYFSNGTWQVARPGEGVRVVVDDRGSAIDAMIAMLPPRDSWTTQEPPGLRQLP